MRNQNKRQTNGLFALIFNEMFDPHRRYCVVVLDQDTFILA